MDRKARKLCQSLEKDIENTLQKFIMHQDKVVSTPLATYLGLVISKVDSF